MKRYILFYLFLLSTISGYCQKSPFYNIDLQLDNTDSFIISTNSYYALNDVKVINADWAYNGKKIKKGETILANYIIYTIDDYILAGRKGNWVFSDYVAIKDSDILPDYLLHKNLNNEIVWISDWYKDVIQLSHTEAIKYINKKYLQHKIYILPIPIHIGMKIMPLIRLVLILPIYF